MRHIVLLLLLLPAFLLAPLPAASQGGAPVYVPLVAGQAGPPTTPTSVPTVQPTPTPAGGLVMPTGRWRMPCTVLDQVPPSPVLYTDQVYFVGYCVSGLPTGLWLFRFVGADVQAVELVEPSGAATAGVAPIGNYGPARASLLAADNLTVWSYPSEAGNGRGAVLSVAGVEQ